MSEFSNLIYQLLGKNDPLCNEVIFDKITGDDDTEYLDLEDILDLGLSKSELSDLLQILNDALLRHIDNEPKGRSTDKHIEWEDTTEYLEDLIDEISERLDD